MSWNTGKSGNTYEISHLVDFWSCFKTKSTNFQILPILYFIPNKSKSNSYMLRDKGHLGKSKTSRSLIGACWGWI